MKYRTTMVMTASCVVEFEAPDDATEEQLTDAAYRADLPTLCHQCAGERNQHLDIGDDWTLYTAGTGKPQFGADE